MVHSGKLNVFSCLEIEKCTFNCAKEITGCVHSSGRVLTLQQRGNLHSLLHKSSV